MTILPLRRATEPSGSVTWFLTIHPPREDAHGSAGFNPPVKLTDPTGPVRESEHMRFAPTDNSIDDATIVAHASGGYAHAEAQECYLCDRKDLVTMWSEWTPDFYGSGGRIRNSRNMNFHEIFFD